MAGRTLLVESPVRVGLPRVYERFTARAGVDIALRVRPGPLPSPRGPLLFESGGAWSAHAHGRGVAYAFRSQGPGSAPDRLLVVDRALTRGTLHVAPFRAGSPRPLAYPLDDLVFQHHLARAGRLVVHGCGLVVDGGAVLFAGPSGAGKTTTARLWSRRAPGTRVLSDDRVVVDRALVAHGTPWHGEGRFAAPSAAPLRALFFIAHGAASRAVPVRGAEAAARLFARTFPPPWDADAIARTLRLCARVVSAVPAWELRFAPDAGAIAAVREALAR